MAAGCANLGVNSAAAALNLNSFAFGFNVFFAGAGVVDAAAGAAAPADFAALFSGDATGFASLTGVDFASLVDELLVVPAFFSGDAGVAAAGSFGSTFASLPFV